MNAKWIGADLLQTAPDEFFVLTEQDLDEYPTIRDAITNQGTGKVNYDEFMRTKNFLDEKGSHVVKFGDEYYEILFITA
jgi:hypothetical protein